MLNGPHLSKRLTYEWRRIRRQGLYKLPFKAGKHVLRIFLWVALLPVTIVLHVVGYRRVPVFTERIGHLALEPDCLLKDQTLGLIAKHRWFILAPRGRIANKHLLNYWKPWISIHEGRVVCYILESMSLWVFMRHDISHYILAFNRAQAAYRIYAQWGDRPPLLSLTSADEEWGKQALRRLGLPDGAWFVCVHVREAGFSPVDEELHAHRNGTIEAAIPAMQEITQRGGWVVRIGDPSMKQLSPLPQVIDYAHHALKSERLDIILCAKSRFILGNTSGIALVGTAFGVPCAMANMIPTPTLWFQKHDISIPKLLWSEDLGRHLSFGEILTSPVALFRYAILYREAMIRVDENTAEDITELVVEMLERLDGSFSDLVEDSQRSQRFRWLLQHNHHAVDSCARVGALFLRKHAYLLSDPPSTTIAGGSV